MILSRGGGTWAGTLPWDQVHPLGPGTLPLDQVHPPGTRYTPPRDQVHHPGTRYTSPRPGTPPGRSACREIRATSGRYASYWNAFLFFFWFFFGFCKWRDFASSLVLHLFRWGIFGVTPKSIWRDKINFIAIPILAKVQHNSSDCEHVNNGVFEPFLGDVH